MEPRLTQILVRHFNYCLAKAKTKEEIDAIYKSSCRLCEKGIITKLDAVCIESAVNLAYVYIGLKTNSNMYFKCI